MAATSIMGISTIGVKFGWAINKDAKVVPSAFTQIERINSIGAIELSTDTIDASALEDDIEKSIAGRQSTGGTWEIVVNTTPDTIDQMNAMIDAYWGEDYDASNVMWANVYSKDMGKSFYVIVEPPRHIPMPEMNQNELMTVSMSFTIVDYYGDGELKEPTPA